MSDTKMMLQTILDGQSSLKNELINKIDEVNKRLGDKIDRVGIKFTKSMDGVGVRLDCISEKLADKIKRRAASR